MATLDNINMRTVLGMFTSHMKKDFFFEFREFIYDV